MSRDKETGAKSGPGRFDDKLDSGGARSNPHRYWAFLSYSHADSEQADWLHKTIETFRVPKAMVGRLTANGVVPNRLSPIFRDRHELAASSDLGQTIREALGHSRFLIVLCSPSAATSKWVNEEIIAFKKAHGEERVLAAIVDGEPWASGIAGREDEECFPPALRTHVDRRGKLTSRAAEPIAADLREGRDGRQTGLLKLVAGMFGLGLDDLVQRDQQRRQKRLTWIAAASIAGMAMTSGLAVFAFDKRDEAREQRREAEGLVAYMTGDLTDKLEPIGKLDALDGVGARVLAYYSKQDASELSDAGLLQRARALSLTGRVAYLRLDYDGATRLYREAAAGTGEAVRRDPDDPQRLFEHAQNVFWIGEIARWRGQAGQAEKAYREYKRLADRMVAIEPDNLRWRMEVFYANENIGIVLYNQRRFAEAARQFDTSLGPMESLASLDPRNAGYQKELSTLLAWQGDAHSSLGHLDRAIAFRERQVAFLRGLVAEGRSDVVFRQELIPAQMALGILFVAKGMTERGIELLRLSVAEGDRLIPVEPDNAYWLRLAARAKLQLAMTLLSTNRATDAAAAARTGCAQAASVLTRDPSEGRDLITTCLTVRSRMAMAGGGGVDAVTLAARAVASARTERSADPIKDRYTIAAAHRLLGDARQRTGDRETARAAWTAGLAQLPRNATGRPWEMNERAGLLRRLGRIDEARPIEERLAAIGYRNES